MAALRRDPIGLTTGTQGSSMPVIYSNMHGFGIRFQEIDTDTFAGQARDLQQHARLTCMYGRMHIYNICIYEGCKPMTNKQARSSCKPQILPCIHASTLDVLTNSFGKLDHHPVAEIQSRRTAYSRIHATSSSTSSPTSPTHRGLDDATTWRLHSEPHPHGSSTPIRIKHNRDLHGSKSACMQANKEEVCVHVHVGQL